MMAIAGVATVAAAFALLHSFRPAPGQVVRRSEWIEITVAILFTTGFGIGTMMTVVGIAALLPS